MSDAAIRSRTTRFASAPAASQARNAPVPSGDTALERSTATSDPRITPDARSASRSRWIRRASPSVTRSALFTSTTCRPSRGSHDRRNSSWRTASAYFSWSVTHATASTSGSSASTRARCSPATESMSGRSRIATEPRPVVSCSRVSRTSSQSSSGSSASRSVRGIQAIGSAVVGRSAEARLTSPPASALSRLDLPTPVPPTSARTYASPGKPTRRAPVSWAARNGWLSRPRRSAASDASSAAARQRDSGSVRTGGGLPSRAGMLTGESIVAVMPRRP